MVMKANQWRPRALFSPHDRVYQEQKVFRNSNLDFQFHCNLCHINLDFFFQRAHLQMTDGYLSPIIFIKMFLSLKKKCVFKSSVIQVEDNLLGFKGRPKEKKEKRLGVVLWCNPLFPALRKQRQGDLCEFQDQGGWSIQPTLGRGEGGLKERIHYVAVHLILNYDCLQMLPLSTAMKQLRFKNVIFKKVNSKTKFKIIPITLKYLKEQFLSRLFLFTIQPF